MHRGEVVMTEVEDSFQDAVNGLQEVAHEVKPPDAWRDFGDVSMDEFWQAWPEIRAWGEWLWQLVDKERGERAGPAEETEHDDIGGGG